MPRDITLGGFWGHLGMRAVETSFGKCTLELELNEKHLQVYGFAHGGVIASLLDSAIGLAGHTVLNEDEGCNTVELKVNYIRPAQGSLTCYGEIVQAGNNLMVGKAELKTSDGKLIAIATGSLFRRQAAQIRDQEGYR